MNRSSAVRTILIVSFVTTCLLAKSPASVSPTQNRTPLAPKAFLELPLGSISPQGWLRDQLQRQADGLTGHLDERYARVVGPRNGWLGGDGDGWERGPYWIDGLLPLAYLLDDEALKAKVKPWVEWSLTHAADDGYFGPVPFEQAPQPEPGIQKTPRRDWWPKMVMLKILQQHYMATGDQRVIDLMLNYFRYQLKTLPQTPLDNWSFWANRRGGDNLMVVYWLYNITGESFLLELAELIGEQTFPWTEVFLNDDPAPSPDLTHLYHYNTGNRYPFNTELIKRLSVDQLQAFHCVNFAQGIKEPIIYYQQHPEQRYVDAVKNAFALTKRFHGQPQGMYGGDEPLHGTVPTQGVEFCSLFGRRDDVLAGEHAGHHGRSGLCQSPGKNRLQRAADPGHRRLQPPPIFPGRQPGQAHASPPQLLRGPWAWPHGSVLWTRDGLPLLYVQYAPGLAQVRPASVVRDAG